MTLNPVKRAIRTLGNLYVEKLLKREYQSHREDLRGPNERPLEYSLALNALLLTSYTDILDVGCGQSAWPAILMGCGYHVTAIDKISGYWTEGFVNHHVHVVNDDITSPRIKSQFGIITCLSTLEHINEHEKAMNSMATLLKPEGILILSFPYNERRYIPNVYKEPGAGYGQSEPYICQVFNRQCIESWLRATSLHIAEQRYFRAFSGDFWTFGQRIWPAEEVGKDDLHHLTGLIVRK